MMDTPQISPERQFNLERWRTVSYALVIGMIICGMLTLVSFLNRLEPSWRLFHVELIAFLVALDRFYVHQRFKRISLFSSKWFTRFISQWIILAVLIRLSVALLVGPSLLPLKLPSNPSEFLLSVFTFDFFFALFIAMIVWLIAGQFADLLDDLSDQEAIVRLSLNYSTSESRTPRQRLVGLVFIMGGALVLLSAFSRFDLRALLTRGINDMTPGLPAFTGAGGSTLLYFLLALVLLSLSQFLELYTVWSLQRIPVNRVVVQRWPLYSLLFLSALTLLVSILPTQYGLGLFGLLNYVLNLILYILFLFAQLILLIAFLIISLGITLFKIKMPEGLIPRGLPIIQPLPVETIPLMASPPWWEAARSTVFLIFLGAVLILAVWQYLRLHKDVFKALRRAPSWHVLTWVWKLFGGVKTGIEKIVEAGLARLRRRASVASGGYLSLRRLSPRQRVRFFYLALIRRGAETGLTRSPAQTPQEYAATLDRALPEAESDIDALTEEFIKARYTRVEVAAEEASQVKSWWERIKKLLQQRKEESGK